MSENKKKMDWSVAADFSSLNVDLHGVYKLAFDPSKLFRDWGKFDEVEKLAGINGIKQKLADGLAKNKDEVLTAAEKRDHLNTVWARLTVERKWNKGVGSKKGVAEKNVAILEHQRAAILKTITEKTNKGVAAALVAAADGLEIDGIGLEAWKALAAAEKK